MKLNQVIAIVKGRKARAQKAITEAYRGWAPNLLTGLTKNYKPLDEDGEKLPSESKVVAIKVQTVLEDVLDKLRDYQNVVLTQEYGNQTAKADVRIDGKDILKDVPVTGLLFLEKQLVDLLTFTKALPILSIDKEWKYDNNRGVFITEPEVTSRSKKLPEKVVKYEATKEHPAQVEMFGVDKVVGNWTTVHMSGAIRKENKDNVIKRIEKMQDAVKRAREEANNQIITGMKDTGTIFLKYIFADEK
jgi:hypothetical protein